MTALTSCDTQAFTGSSTRSAYQSHYDDVRAVANGTSMSGRTSGSGHTWTVHSGTMTVQTTAGAFGNAIGETTSSRGLCTLDLGTADVDIEAQIEVDGSHNGSGGIAFRRDSSDDFYYAGHLAGTGAGLYKATLASTTLLVAFSDDNAIYDGDFIRVVTSGSSIQVYRNRKLVVSTTDSTYTGTRHGFYTRSSSGVRCYTFNWSPVFPATDQGRAWAPFGPLMWRMPDLDGSGKATFLTVAAGAERFRLVVDAEIADVAAAAYITTDNNGRGGVVVRQASGDQRCYLVSHNGGAGGGATYVYKLDSAGAATLATTLTAAATWSAAKELKVQVIGDTMTVYQDDVSAGTHTMDSAYAGFTRHGFGAWGNSNPSFDNFELCPAAPASRGLIVGSMALN